MPDHQSATIAININGQNFYADCQFKVQVDGVYLTSMDEGGQYSPANLVPRCLRCWLEELYTEQVAGESGYMPDIPRPLEVA